VSFLLFPLPLVRDEIRRKSIREEDRDLSQAAGRTSFIPRRRSFSFGGVVECADLPESVICLAAYFSLPSPRGCAGAVSLRTCSVISHDARAGVRDAMRPLLKSFHGVHAPPVCKSRLIARA